ncbi:NAD(P)-binding protein [Ottowia thiooxydans]|uniref:NAD(P)-binding protein n=1 Tax=Ottowia thiooxydans TaxID=219182 RepID=UPI00048F5AB1|nr:NAD(P)-binding protein [Ottowia thiooxydans]
MTTAIVAGGGIAGLLSAKLLARQYDQVLLVERDANCGGLLGSISNDDGIAFDHGAHILSDTGLAEIDSLLYGDLSEEKWHTFRMLRAGNWFVGAMNRNSPFPDARRVGENALRKALAEIAAAPIARHETAPTTLAESLERRFGTTLASLVAGPTIRKQLGVAPGQLHPLTPFVIRRIICADAEETRRLKQDSRFSEPLAFASYEEGVGSTRHRYPRTGGIGQWVDGFVQGLRRDGVEIACGRTIAAVTHDGGKITSISLDDGRTVSCSMLTWTLPPALLLRAANIPFEGRPPLSRPIGLFHLVFDEPFQDPNYHVTCYDESLRIFRVTLYPNLRGQPLQAPYNCTIEVIGDTHTDFQALLPQVVQELKLMGIVPSPATLLSSMVSVVPIGFPATTHAFMDSMGNQTELAENHLRNALLVGRARCPPFFTTDVLTDVFQSIKAFSRV